MDILILGGTAFLGRATANAALAAGHSVTCLARGLSATPPEGATFVRADRSLPDAYDEVQRAWDVVIDVGRQPGQVRAAIAALGSHTGHWVFVSTGNVYADNSTRGSTESAPVLTALEGDVMESMESYGPAKVACEVAVSSLPSWTIARAGLIGGPGDLSGRTGYWPWRFARSSTVVVPDQPDWPVEIIDVRDLATWLVHCGTTGVQGVFNAVGETHTLSEVLRIAQDVAGSTAVSVPVAPALLAELEVTDWMGPRSLPLWVEDESWIGFCDRSDAAALAAGLTRRPLAETLGDVLRWELASPHDLPRRAGLTDDEQDEILLRLDART